MGGERKVNNIRIYFLLACVFLSCPLFFSYAYPARGLADMEPIDGPRLIAPATDDIDLSGKTTLKFQWSCGYMMRTDHFEFRLYKGYNRTKDNLIHKEDIPSGDAYFELPVSMFEQGQVYTWSLRQILIGGNRSDTSSSSFTVVKK